MNADNNADVACCSFDGIPFYHSRRSIDWAEEIKKVCQILSKEDLQVLLSANMIFSVEFWEQQCDGAIYLVWLISSYKKISIKLNWENGKMAS